MRVLSSASPPGPGSNPYLVLLHRSLEPTVDVAWFSWPAALLGRYDVLHLHWPEVKLRGRTRVRTLLRWFLFTALLVRLKAGRRALVRTLHNAAPHEPLPAPARALVRLCERWTTAWVVLTPSLRPAGAPVVAHIPHGHYRDWVSVHPRQDAATGRVLHIGLLRRYKGIDSVLDAVAQVPAAAMELRVVGAAADPSVAELVAEASRRDPRISLDDRYVSDRELVHEVTGAELVVLPHAGDGSSGTLLMALSLDRPVLVPAGPVSDELAEEVGPGWVHRYEGPLTGDVLLAALRASRSRSPGRPDLGRRNWAGQATAHRAVYDEAVRRAGERGAARDR